MSEESTTPDLVERTRAFIAAANRRDSNAMVAFYAPDAVWHKSGNLDGAAAIRDFHEDWMATMRSTRSRSSRPSFLLGSKAGRPTVSSAETSPRRVVDCSVLSML